MGSLTDNFGNKAPGQLIRSQDWNGLITAIEEMEIGLAGQVTALSTRVDGVVQDLTAQIGSLSAEVAAVRTDLDGLRAEVVPVLRDLWRLTLQTTRVRYALGDVAEIEAHVTDLAGRPLQPAEGEELPWIDFVAAWGQLKPSPGFTSLGSTGDRALSVQVNADGVARVRLRAEQADGLPDDVDDEVASSLTTRLQATNLSVSRHILEAETPMEASRAGAFQVLAAEYDRADSSSVRKFVDSYYVRYAPKVATPVFNRPVHAWNDYRSTVLAFVRKDSDPLTPDQSRGASSIQITFRDWVAPFIHLDYLPLATGLARDLVGTLSAGVVADLGTSIVNLRDRVGGVTRNLGVLGRQKGYLAVRQALDEIPDALGPAFVPDLKRAMRDAVSLQQTLDRSQLSTPGAEEDVAVGVFTNAALRADVGSAHVVERVSKLVTQVEEVDTKVTAQQATLTAGLGTVQRQVAQFTVIDPTEVRTKLSDVAGLANRLAALEQRR